MKGEPMEDIYSDKIKRLERQIDIENKEISFILKKMNNLSNYKTESEEIYIHFSGSIQWKMYNFKKKNFNYTKKILTTGKKKLHTIAHRSFHKNIDVFFEKIKEKCIKYSSKTNEIEPSLQHRQIEDFLVTSAKNEYLEKNVDSNKVAVQIHIFYPDLLNEIFDNLNSIPADYDLYISTDTDNKKEIIYNYFILHHFRNFFKIQVYENKGRDILPFIIQLRPVINKYKYICHLHTKKSSNVFFEYGDSWRKYLFKNILGNKENVLNIFNTFNINEKCGIIFPPDFPLIHNTIATKFDDNPALLNLFNRYNIVPNDGVISVYPAGDMFWAKTEAIKDLFFDINIDTEMEKENNQKDKTLAHAIERVWYYLAEKNGYTYARIFNNSLIKENHKNRIVFFTHSNRCITESDIDYIKALKKIGSVIVFINNSDFSLGNSEIEKEYISVYIERADYGHDFGSWRDGLFIYGVDNLDSFDEIVFVNDSCYAPLYPLENIFSEMDEHSYDFWGLTMQPVEQEKNCNQCSTKDYINPYFIVFSKKVIKDYVFLSFCNSNDEKTDSEKMRMLTDCLLKTYSYGCYTAVLNSKCTNFGNSDYMQTEPLALLQLGMPLMKIGQYYELNYEKKLELRKFISKISDKRYYTEFL
jgi:lipopolysaccharide biosynthesis protein